MRLFYQHLASKLSRVRRSGERHDGGRGLKLGARNWTRHQLCCPFLVRNALAMHDREAISATFALLNWTLPTRSGHSIDAGFGMDGRLTSSTSSGSRPSHVPPAHGGSISSRPTCLLSTPTPNGPQRPSASAPLVGRSTPFLSIRARSAVPLVLNGSTHRVGQLGARRPPALGASTRFRSPKRFGQAACLHNIAFTRSLFFFRMDRSGTFERRMTIAHSTRLPRMR